MIQVCGSGLAHVVPNVSTIWRIAPEDLLADQMASLGQLQRSHSSRGLNFDIEGKLFFNRFDLVVRNPCLDGTLELA